jgi:hypothetical protein
MEWPSNLMLSAVVAACDGMHLLLAQSVGYKYLLSSTGTISLVSDESSGGKYWKKRLTFEGVAAYIACQIAATDDNDIQGDCRYGCMFV